MEDVHGCEAEQEHHNALGAFVHLQVPDHENGQNSKGPVGKCVQSGAYVGQVDNHCCVDAAALCALELPPEGDWRALQQDNQEVRDREAHGGYSKDPEDPSVHRRDGNP